MLQESLCHLSSSMEPKACAHEIEFSALGVFCASLQAKELETLIEDAWAARPKSLSLARPARCLLFWVDGKPMAIVNPL